MPTKRTGKKTKGKPPVAMQPVLPGKEELLASLLEVFEQQGITAPGDAEALLRSLDALDEEDLGEGSAERDQAQELAFAAMEALTFEKAIALYREALTLDPDCVDAIAGLTGLESDGVEEIAGLERAVAAGERVLGAAFFKRNRGSFWGLIQTRPYMRARAELGMLLLESGRTAEAATHFAEMLELNPNDNQGVRETLMVAYLALGDLERARGLRTRYEHDAGALWSWSAVLEDFLSGGPARAKVALREARKMNRFVEDFLNGAKKLPAAMPESYQLGGKDEACLCAESLGVAVAAHPQFRAWLRAHTMPHLG